jgi:carboxymethylenebutenolidase
MTGADMLVLYDSWEAQQVRRIMGEFETLEVGGKTSRLYVAGDVRPGAAGVVVLHPWWGLNDDVIAYVDKLAGAGFAVTAPDMFDGQVASTIEDAERLSGAAERGDAEPSVEAIALAAVDDLAERLGPASRLGVLGFSFGAAYATLLPAERDRLVASVDYYGVYTGPHIDRSSAAVLGHFAEADQFESDEGIAELEDTLRAAGREVTIHRYPGTGHWFAEPSREAYRAEAADLAFERTVAFFQRHLSAGQPAG